MVGKVKGEIQTTSPKTIADLTLKHGPGEFQWWEGGRTGRWFLHWLGSRSWHLIAIANNEELKDKAIEWLKIKL